MQRHNVANRSLAIGSKGRERLDAASVELRATICIARPPRVAIGVPNGVKPAGWCNLLQRVTSRWGGLDSTIYFPADGWTPGSLWDGLLQRFDPDYIMFYRNPHNIDVFKERYDPFRCWSYRWMFHADKGSLPVDWAAPLHVAARGWAASENAEPLAIIHSGNVVGGPECLRIVLANESGWLSAEELGQITAAGGRSHIAAIEEPIELPDTATAGWNVLEMVRRQDPASPRSWSARGLGVLQSWGNEEWREGPILVMGSDTADVCLWLTLRTLRQSPSVLWWPDEMVPNPPGDGDTCAHGYTHGLASALSGAEQVLLDGETLEEAYDQDTIYVSSTSLADGQMRDRWQMLEQRRPGFRSPRFGSDPLSCLRVYRFSAVPTLREQAYQFTAGVSHAYLTPEVPNWMQTAPRAISFLTEFSVDGLATPTHPATRPLLAPHRPPAIPHRSGRYGPVAAQCSRIVPIARGEPPRYLPLQIRFPDIEEVLIRFGAWLGGTATFSDAGRLSRDLVGRFADLAVAAASLRSGPLAAVVEEFLRTYQGNEAIRSGSFPTRDRLYIDRNGLSSLILGADQSADADEFLNGWTLSGVILWGMLLKCPRCRFQALYQWRDFGGSGPECQRCARHFQITPNTASAWEPVAALDELVRASLIKDAREAIVLAAWLVSQDSAASVILGTEWIWPRGHAETDVTATLRGHLVLGEAKSNEKVETTQCNQYEGLARRTQARRLIFATSKKQWAPGMAAKFSKITQNLTGTSVEAYVDLLADGGPQRVC